MSDNPLNIGWFEFCLNVADLDASLEFYLKLGFRIVHDGRDNNFVTLFNDDVRISLFKGHIDRNLLNFRGADVHAVAAELKSRGLSLSKDAHIEKDGSAAAEIIDPDGNVIYFNTHPSES